MENKSRINGYGHRIAAWLQAKSKVLPLTLQRWIAGIAVCCVAVYCGLLVAGGGSGLGGFGSITRPVGPAETGELRLRITTLSAYLDSLGLSEQGRMERDSILRMNPGLLDSIASWRSRVQEMERQ